MATRKENYVRAGEGAGYRSVRQPDYIMMISHQVVLLKTDVSTDPHLYNTRTNFIYLTISNILLNIYIAPYSQTSQIPFPNLHHHFNHFDHNRSQHLAHLIYHLSSIYNNKNIRLMSVDIRQSLNCLRLPSRYESVSRSQLSKQHTGDSTREPEKLFNL